MKKRSKIILAVAGLAAASAVSYGIAAAGSEAAAAALTDLPIGKPAPKLSAKDVNGRVVSLSDFPGKTVVLEWNNPECPTVEENYNGGTMQRTQAAAAADGVVWLTINSSGPWRQGHMDGAQAKAYVAAQKAQPSAYLLDPDGVAGKAYGAKATPHMYVINNAGTLVYRGGIKGGIEGPSDRNHVLAALSELKAGKPISVSTSRPYGCSVKYKW